MSYLIFISNVEEGEKPFFFYAKFNQWKEIDKDLILMIKRQAERIAVAKAKGVKFGRPPRPIPDNFYEVYQQWKAKKITLKQVASLCEMPETTFFDKAKKFGKTDFLECRKTRIGILYRNVFSSEKRM